MRETCLCRQGSFDKLRMTQDNNAMQDEIRNTRNEFLALVTSAENQEELENLRASYLGKNGKITNLIKGIRNVPSDQKAEVGQLINETKKIIEEELRSQL